MQSEDTRNVVGICRAAAEAMISERIQWRLDPKYILALCDTVAALSDKQAGEVNARDIIDRSHTIVEDVLDMALYLHGCPRENIGKYQGAANRLAAFMNEVRSALVDVPAEPVAKQWCAYEDGQQHTSWYPDGYGDRAGWEALAKRNPAKYQVVTRDLFTSPPLSREGEDSAEVDGLTKALMAAYEEFNRIACEFVTETRSAPDALDRCHVFANRGASGIRAALAATRSGSATTASGTSAIRQRGESE